MPNQKMRALVKPKSGPGLEMRMVDIPTIGPHDVLVKVKATSICGTDRHIYEWNAWAQSRIKPPLIIGHEFCGYVVAVGKDVTLLKEGDFVSAESHIPDTTCPVCRQGAQHICANLKILGVDTPGCFADYAVLPEICAWKNDPDLDPAIASIQEPLGNAVYTVLAEPITGKTVAVFGDGPAGLNAVAVARASGAGTIFHVGKYPFRLDIGKKLGATFSINITEPGVDVVRIILDATEGVGVDVTLEMTGNQDAITQGFAVLRKAGRFSAFGLPSGPIQLDLNNAIIFKGARVLGINGRLMWDTWYQMAGLLKSGKLDPSPVITHKIPLDDFEKGFEAMCAPDRKCGKVVMFPDPADI
ncbi:MAG: L-threonine 3-dehydrogenase [Chloroflexi bacterium]|nr:L-threonine 3-dehydrogenase [Chloroflexota bacterium]